MQQFAARKQTQGAILYLTQAMTICLNIERSSMAAKNSKVPSSLQRRGKVHPCIFITRGLVSVAAADRWGLGSDGL
ncbi:hypothetical protein LINGRAHAP2_LOCUS6519 [Linum grandiflorum]